jgi:hypothetical protein
MKHETEMLLIEFALWALVVGLAVALFHCR